ncbi:class I SAM-dependent methyltransferase [Cnuibacter physcomitrellae]|uniref:class I SAM-dependent methyltransferase n=1 Tax=Cnuibacter physcomitrellae TaxID=1619308 RepID=UPI002175B6A1|nr:class I SAM-dependent methyltransferase [Cnuibacter physcomitrellae]MCS5496765.1 class I SAM-dependent methyltransferase [Cnuibacter physcomitrellae]
MTVLGSLSRRAADLQEYMDDPACDRRRLDATYARFRLVNRIVAGWRGIYRDHIRPRLSDTMPSTLLDLGCGGGDVARSLATWAAHDGLQLAVTAIDPDERAYEFASRQPGPPVVYRQASSADLVAEAARFDVVVSNHVLHHLDREELAAFFFDSELLCRGIALHGDIRRSRLAYAAYSLGSLPIARGSFIRDDGLTSIRRSYTAKELRATAPLGWEVEERPMFRNLLIHRAR